MTRNIICISCPIGCPLTVCMENDKVTSVEGNECARGTLYAEKECVNPTRILTSSLPVEGRGMLSVKTAADIPKSSIFKCMKALEGLKVKPPIRIGDVILTDVAGTGVNIVATRNVD